MTRQSSIDVWKEINNGGYIGRKQLQVYNVIYKHGPMSGAEVSKFMRIAGQRKNLESENVRNRITELVKLGIVREIGRDICPISNRSVLFFEVSGEMPAIQLEMLPRMTKKKAIFEAVNIINEYLAGSSQLAGLDVIMKIRELLSNT